MSNHKFKFAIGDMIKSKDGMVTLLVLGYQHVTDPRILLPCYKVCELDKGAEREWSCRYIEGHYKRAT